MLLDIIKQFNWVDIFVVIILFRIGYVAIKSGLTIELFKLLGTLAALYVSLHYYTLLADWIMQRLAFAKEKMPLEFLDFVCFLFLAAVSYSAFILLRFAFYRFIKMEAVPNLNKLGGLILGIVRGFLLVGLIVFMLVISSIQYLKTSVIDSYSGRRLFKIAPATYSRLWNVCFSKFAAKEKINQTVFELQEDLK